MKWVTERLQKENEQLLSELLTFWWERVDSNHRSDTQQIYSLPHLATLPTELNQQVKRPKKELNQQTSKAVQQQKSFYQIHRRLSRKS